MAGPSGSSERCEPEFQIAPMVDVLLVLLIFFMSITTAEILKLDDSITLPLSPNANRHDPKLSRMEVAVNVRWDAEAGRAVVTMEDNEYPNAEELVARLRLHTQTNPGLRAVIRGDKRLPAIEIQRVMNAIGESGISDVSFAAASK
jgi:biopolymer transport protein ExbD